MRRMAGTNEFCATSNSSLHSPFEIAPYPYEAPYGRFETMEATNEGGLGHIPFPLRGERVRHVHDERL